MQEHFENACKKNVTKIKLGKMDAKFFLILKSKLHNNYDFLKKF